MRRIWAIACNTWREAIRDRIYLGLGVFAVLLLAATQIVAPLALGEGGKITRDFGLSGLVGVSLLMTIFVGTGLVHKEIDRKTVMTLLSKPIARGEFVIGKYLGLVMTLAMIFGAMLAMLLGLLILRGEGLDRAVLLAGLLSLGELVIVTGVAIFFSTCTSPMLSGLFTLAVFVAGHFTADMKSFADQVALPVAGWVSRAGWFLFPHLELFDGRSAAAHGVAPLPAQFALGAAYAGLYVIGLLALAVVIFERREFR